MISENSSFEYWTVVLAIFLIIGCISSADAQNHSGKRLLKVDDLFALKKVGSPVISPDGEWIAYTVKSTQLKENRSSTRIWMKPVSGGDPIPMTLKDSSAMHPAWSPDGKYLSFTASRNGGKNQLWVLNRKGGEGQQITNIKQGIEDYAWSPDGRKVALVIKETVDDTLNKDSPKPIVVTRLQFKQDYQGYLDTLKTHIYVYDLANDSLRQITSGNYNEYDPVWSPDGHSIAFVSNRTDQPDANQNTDIWTVQAGNTNKGAGLNQVTTNPGSDTSPAWSPDGKRLTYVSSVEPDIIWYATNHLAVIDKEGGPPQLLTKNLDRNVSDPQFSTDGTRIYFKLEDSGEQQLAVIDTSGEGLKRIISGGLSLWSYDVNAKGTIAAGITKPQLPDEIFLLRDNNLSQFTSVNQPMLDSLRLAEVKNIHFKSKDGTEIEGFMTLPINYEKGKHYPTLLRIHGGPVAQFSYEFNFNAQLFAAHGYIVLNVNPRGSSGYGQEFSHAIWADWGHKDYEDVMAAVDYAIEQGYADPDRLGVGGWSYGGILTNYVITQTDRFDAAISGASEVLYTANYGHDHYQYQWEQELGLPWENQSAWDRISPFWDVEEISTPTLIMGGASDWNVPIQNSEQLYQALKRLGKVDTKLVVYPDEHHGISKPSFQKDRLERYLNWYERYVK